MIGHPIAQVKSPATFNRFFKERGMDAVMIPVDVDPGEVAHFFSFMRGWRNCPGCIVTMPHKQESCRLADELTARARDLSAVNVVRRTEEGKLVGDMVDGLGFIEALRRNGFDLNGKRAVIFGAGGAGSAIAYSAALEGAAELALVDIDISRQGRLADLIGSRFPSVKTSTRVVSLAGFDLAVNAAPLGMNGDSQTPFPLDTLQSSTLVADVVTEPDMTPWLKEAEKRGCRVQTGYEMTLGQFAIMGRHMGIEMT
ncbi:MAG: shikimate dehydrogenase [Desulfobacteraceae bacterium]|nr:MAG: shikimate dehydrogenase [Desulfobacteraceae bacterium]